ncbi:MULTISPECIES: hypothetical protein [unclassified Microcoleus]|uniref:hypothetical protein n=1 Tax=unclassified Microcoleus TaxID=2642155 RepID=UPI001D61671E|nr:MULTISPECIES: hypothetical protein [unclassified Microcoleus]MCC3473814.1 hypothetical protein [Microcoleus sp. PH2017_13_LAR_U_A]MCC3486251.1 hypothetical protein [Microcoleus sp. PH2017_14_LAR_D_A]
MFKNKYYPIVLIPDSIAAVIKARNAVEKTISNDCLDGARTKINLQLPQADTTKNRKSHTETPAIEKISLQMPVVFLYLACLTAMLAAMQFAAAALLTAAFCFYCCYRSRDRTETMQAKCDRTDTLQANRTQTQISQTDRDLKAALQAKRENATINTHLNKIVDSLLPIDPNIIQHLKKVKIQTAIELKQISADAIKPLLEKATAQEGATESFFLSHLRKLLPSLHTVQGVPFAIPGSKLRYSCDFIAVHPETGIAADIEIDEPYVGTNNRYGKPHHCFDCNRDNNRNQFFVQGNWIVIRFAEEQIALQPAACCKLIARIFAEVIGDPKIAEPLKTFPNLLPVKQWNTKTATAMAMRNYRQTYLSKAGINLTNSFTGFDRKKHKKRHHR